MMVWSFMGSMPCRWKKTVAPAAGVPLTVTLPVTGYSLGEWPHELQANAKRANAKTAVIVQNNGFCILAPHSFRITTRLVPS